MTLTEFLLARIAEDEAVIEATREGWHVKPRATLSSNIAALTVGMHPSRARAECGAKRAIANFADYWRGDANDYGQADQALRIVSAVYADHPDYRQEWKP